MNWESANIFLYFIINIFDLWVILRYFNKLMELLKQKKAILYCKYFLFLVFFTFLIKSELKYSNIVSITMWSCMFLPTYKGEKRNKLVYAVLLLGLAGFSQMTMFILSHRNIHAIYLYFIPHFIFFAIVEISIKCQTVKGKIIEPKFAILLMSIPFFSFVAMTCIVLISERVNQISLKEETTMLIPIVVLILYMNIVVFHLYDTISSTFDVKRQKDEYEQRLIWQQNYYDSLAENQDAIRKIKHDMQNNLQVISSLLIDKKTDKAINYLKELIIEQAKVNNLITTGNDAIDTVLNIKFSLAEKYGIKVKRDINIPAGLPIPYHHCIRIFGNLLDNAINALKDQKEIEKTINLFMFFKANALIIQVSNQYKDKPVEYNEDSFLHGLGLDIVKTTTEFYNGAFEIEDDGKNFTVNIMLYLDI